jgi:hypothetical protein
MFRNLRLTALVFLLLAILAPVAYSTPVTTTTAPFVTVGVGDTFTVPIFITGGVELTSWQFDLAFDSSIVRINSVTEGPFFTSVGATMFTPGFNFPGQMSGVADSYIDIFTPPSGGGDPAYLSFTALTSGVSLLTLSNVFLNYQDAGFQVANGQITVAGGAAVPEPSTVALLAGGLVFLGTCSLTRGARRRDEQGSAGI